MHNPMHVALYVTKLPSILLLKLLRNQTVLGMTALDVIPIECADPQIILDIELYSGLYVCILDLLCML